MWPFDEESYEDSNVADFNSVAREIYNQSTDADSGLGALRDVYSEYQFEDKARADEVFSTYTNDIRQRFGVKNTFDYNATLDNAPVNFAEIAGEGDTPDDQKIDQINQWEEQNLNELQTAEDPIYIQNRDFLSTNIRKAAVAQRREIYGTDNYLVTEVALRIGQGAIAPITDAVGVDSVNDWFTEGINPENDDTLFGAVASGVGSAGGAIVSGLATGGYGTLAYLGVSGAGAVRNQVKDSLEAGGSTEEAVEAGLIETGSQVLQTLAGEKVFGGVVKQVLGKGAEKLGARVFPRILGNASLEGAAEGVGQVISNEAANVGQGKDDSLLEGVGLSTAAGFIVGGAASGIGEMASLRVPKVSPQMELIDTIQSIEGDAPPPKEGLLSQTRAVELQNPQLVAEREDGTTLVSEDGRIHAQANGQYAETHDQVFYVSPEIAEKLRENTDKKTGSPDGVGIHLSTENGELYLESDFLNDDLSVNKAKTGTSKKKIEAANQAAPGLVDVSVSAVRDNGGARVFKYNIGTAPLKTVSTVGAAHIGSIKGYKESQYAQRLRATLTNDQQEAYGLASVAFQEDENGNRTEVVNPLFQYLTTPNKAGADVGRNFITENGPVDTLAYLHSLGDKASPGDRYISTLLVADLRQAQTRAYNAGDLKSGDAYNELIGEAITHEARIAGIGGSIMQIGTNQAQNAIGGMALTAENQITNIQQTLRQEAEAELSKEIGVPKVTFQDINNQVKQSDVEIQAAQKEINDPVVAAIAQDEAEIEHLENKKAEPTKALVKQYTEEIQQLQNQQEEQKEVVKGQLSEADVAIKESIESTKGELAQAKDVVEKRKADNKAPTKVQVEKVNKLQSKLSKLNEQFADVQKRTPKEAKTIKNIRSKIAERKVEIRRLNKESKIPKEPNTRQKFLIQRINEVKEGQQAGAFGSKQQRQRLVNALKNKQVLTDRLSLAQQKINEKMKAFPEEAQNQLRQLYSLKGTVKTPTASLKVDQAIFNIESKWLPRTPENVDRLWNYWRKNALSSVDTVMRNIIGNSWAPVSTTAGYAITDLSKLAVGKAPSMDFVHYLEGLGVGAVQGAREGYEIVTGKRAGKLSLSDSTELIQPTPFKNPLRTKNPFHFFTNITEAVQRVTSATDALFSSTAKTGQAYVAAHMTEAQGVPFSERRVAIEKALYKTPERLAQVTAQVEEQAKGMLAAGIKLTPNQKKLMVYEAMEQNRSDQINKMADRHAEKNTFMNDPEGFLGVLAHGINGMTSKWQIKIGKNTIAPLKEVLPFLRTAANIGNFYLDHTPLGLIGAGKAILKGREQVKAGEANTYTLEAREHFGRVMVGTAMTAALAGVLEHYKDDEEPFVAFYGLAPEGEKKKWQALGIPQFSIKVGDSIIPVQNNPLALAFVLADNIVRGRAKQQDPGLIAANTVMAGMGAMANLSFMKNLGDFFEMLQGGEPLDENTSNKTVTRLSNTIKSNVANYAQPFIPASGFLKNIYRWMDGSPQETYNNLSAKLLNQIPFTQGISGSEDRLNMFGEPITMTPWERSPGNLVLGRINDNPVMKWMTATGYKVSDQGPTIKLGKTEAKQFGELREANGAYKDILDEKESIDVLKIAGPQIKDYLEQTMADPYFQVYSQPGQDRINKQINSIRARARMEVLSR